MPIYKNTIIRFSRPLVLLALTLTGFVTSTRAQEVSIPDPGLSAAIRQALNKPAGPLTAPDMLGLTNLDARSRSISRVQGLEAARNLFSLFLDFNSLTNLDLPNTLINLDLLTLSVNPLARLSIPSGLTKLRVLAMNNCLLTNLTLPADLTGLGTLDLFHNRLTDFAVSSGWTNLTVLDLSLNSLVRCSIPAGLTNLDLLFLSGNRFTNFTLPAGLTGLTEFDLSANALTRFTIPADLTNLTTALLSGNQLTDVTVPASLHRLGSLELDFNHLSSLNLPAGLNHLGTLVARDNQLTNLTIPADMTNLTSVDVGGNQLPNLTLPAGLGRLNSLILSENRLTSFTLPPGLTNLATVFLRFNQLTNLTLSADLINLVQIDVLGNQLTSLTLPPDATKLSTLSLIGNPFMTLVLSEPAAATNLAFTVGTLRNQGVSVFTYPLAVHLVQPRTLAGGFQFGLTGPPGVYTVFGSTDLAAWSTVGLTTNKLGVINFTDATSPFSPRKFYRAVQLAPPANMVFIAPNIFTMGSPTNEQDRATDEGPQTTVILTRGYWIGQYEVTQGEWLSVMGTNPSPFPGDLSRPVTSVSWPDATNYCAKLTQQELAAGRIPAGSHYRLPTEAEWECAARAGTTTRFSYGDDPAYASLGSHAWHAGNSGFMPHSIGQKLPNPWGLYDMEGNVVEWCQDWFGLLPGGIQTDPTGPATSSSGRKVTRGGAFDNTQQSCRSAERSLFNAGPFDTDTDLGFRVVLVAGQ
jgi:formylglycine-generating enzyme required for sulfatase activity